MSLSTFVQNVLTKKNYIVKLLTSYNFLLYNTLYYIAIIIIIIIIIAMHYLTIAVLAGLSYLKIDQNAF